MELRAEYVLTEEEVKSIISEFIAARTGRCAEDVKIITSIRTSGDPRDSYQTAYLKEVRVITK